MHNNNNSVRRKINYLNIGSIIMYVTLVGFRIFNQNNKPLTIIYERERVHRDEIAILPKSTAR